MGIDRFWRKIKRLCRDVWISISRRTSQTGETSRMTITRLPPIRDYEDPKVVELVGRHSIRKALRAARKSPERIRRKERDARYLATLREKIWWEIVMKGPGDGR